MSARRHIKRVAIVGSGCAGIGALWALNRTYHDVYMYEASDRLGGHTHTVQWKNGRHSTTVDAGLVMLNSATYPNFMGFLNRLGIETDPTEVSFGTSRDRGAFEWATRGLTSVFCQRRNLFSKRVWKMLFDLVRFNQFALDLLISQESESRGGWNGNLMINHLHEEETIGEYLENEGYSDAFRDDYLIPLIAALWSVSPGKSPLDFPAAQLVRFLWNHRLLAVFSRKGEWLTLRHGSRSYIDAVLKGFPPNHLFLKTPVRNVSREDNGQIRVHLENGSSEVYDHVILTTHGNQALDILGASATAQESSILTCFQTSQNEAVLHSDLTLMPARKKAWAAFNYLTVSPPQSGRSRSNQISLTYNMNILQQIPRDTFGDVLVTLNPLYNPKSDKIQGRYYFSSPYYDTSAIQAQKLLNNIQNTRGISYAGAWTKFGFHEDDFSSGLQVAKEHLGAKLPFEFKDATYIRGRKPSLGIIDLVLRLVILVIQVFVFQLSARVLRRLRRKRVPYTNGTLGQKLNGKRA